MNDPLARENFTTAEYAAVRALCGSDADDPSATPDIADRVGVAHWSKDIAAKIRPVHYREAADSLEHVHPEAARLLRSVAKDLEDEGATE